jgi:hypothetical protein
MEEGRECKQWSVTMRCPTTASSQHKGLGTSYNNRIVKMKEGGGGHNVGDVV